MTTLLDLARHQLEQGDPNAPRRACWLARAALEELVSDLLLARGVEVSPLTSSRSRMSCLEAAYADQADVVSRAEYAWSRLSEACHQHAYQLSPTYVEVRQLLEVVEILEFATPPA